MQSLEQKVGLISKFRNIAGRTIGVYALALALSGMYGCEDENGDNGGGSSSNGCTHNVGGRGGYAESGCGSGSHCECTEKEKRSGYAYTSCGCVSDSSDDSDNSGGWQGGKW